jgi:hypothetical protein
MCFLASRIRILLSSKNVNVPSKSNKQKKIVLKNKFFAGILKVNDKNSRIRIQDPDPDPLVRGMDPRIRGSGSTPKCHESGTLLMRLSILHHACANLPFEYCFLWND